MTEAPATRRPVLLAIAATSVLAIIAIVLAWQLGWGMADTSATPAQSVSPTPSPKDPAVQAQCDKVKAAHDAWQVTNNSLQTFALSLGFELIGGEVKTPPMSVQNKAKLGLIKDAGKAYFDAVDPYTDKPSTTLAVAVAEYNVEVGFVALEAQLGGSILKSTYDKATASAARLETAYKTFQSAACA